MAIAFFDYVAALRESDLPGPVRSVAFWIASRCANGWPVTRETVAADSGFSRATVTRAISELREKGWLVSDRNRRQGNSYQVSIPRFLSAQSEPAIGSERACKEAQSEPLKKSLSAQSEPTVGSEGAYKKAQSEPTYIRTIQEQQEQQEHPRACARPPVREGDAATIKHSDLSQTQLWGWVKELEKDPDAKAEVLKFKFYRTSTGGIYKDAFVTALLSSERLFESFRPWFVRLQAEGKL
jgi:biotin operon repressor